MVVWCNGSTWCCGFSSQGLHEDESLQTQQSPLQSGFDSQHRQSITFALFDVVIFSDGGDDILRTSFFFFLVVGYHGGVENGLLGSGFSGWTIFSVEGIVLRISIMVQNL